MRKTSYKNKRLQNTYKYSESFNLDDPCQNGVQLLLFIDMVK